MTRRRFRARSLDDAGKPVRILDGPGFREWQSSGDLRVQDLSRRVSFALSDRRFDLRDPDLLFFMSPGLLMVLAFGLGSYFSALSGWMTGAVIGLLTLPLMQIGIRRRIARRSGEMIRIMLEEGICPCCGYNLFGLDLSCDRIRCPECGAAWATSRIRRVIPIDEAAKASRIVNAVRQSRATTSAGLEDERGRRVAMVDPRLREARRAAVNVDERAVLCGAREHLVRVGLGIRLLLAALPLGVAVFSLFIMSGHRIGFGGVTPGAAPPTSLLGELVCPLVFAVIGLNFLFGKLGYKPSSVRRILLSHSLCPSCASSLAGIALDTDVCVVCETCGAAWRPSSAAEFA